MVLEGLNPYAAPPGDEVYNGIREELEAADDPLYGNMLPRLNSVRSVYGPIATGFFVVPHLLPWDRVWSCRLMMALFDLGTVLVIMGMLRSLGRAPAVALIYAWNPMTMNGFADRAHIDAPMVFFLALAVWLLLVKRPGWAGVVFGAAMLVKVSPMWLALPLLRVGRLRFLGTLVVMGVLGSIPFALAGEGALSGFREFGATWRNVDSIFALILLALQPLKGVIDPNSLARAIVMVAMPAYAVWVTAGDRITRIWSGAPEGGGAVGARTPSSAVVASVDDVSTPEWLLDASLKISAASLLLSPVVHPWYTAHMLIFLCFVPSRGLLLMTAATMCWFLKFWQPAEASIWGALLRAVKPHREPWRWLAYPPVLSLLLWDWWKARRGAGTPTGTM